MVSGGMCSGEQDAAPEPVAAQQQKDPAGDGVERVLDARQVFQDGVGLFAAEDEQQGYGDDGEGCSDSQ